MSDIFEKWNKNVTQEFTEAVDKLDKGENDYQDVPIGDYEVKIEKMEIKASKKGDPMFVCQFKVLNGEYKNQYIWMNQVIPQTFQIHIVNEFLRSLDTGIDIKFRDYCQYNDLVMDVMEQVSSQKLEYGLGYGEKDGFKTFTILDVFEQE